MQFLFNMLFKIYKRLYKAYGPQKWWPVTSKNKQFEVIIGAILTQNTSWKNVEKAIANLKKAGLIKAEKIKAVNVKKLAKLIKPSGYFNQKAERLKTAAGFFLENKTPSRQELLDIKGIGPETADSILLYALGRPFFVIDMYTKRIMSRIGLCDNKAGYDELQQMFHAQLPKDAEMFNEYHALLVELAKQHCMKKPSCNGCPVAGLCSQKI